MSGNSIEPPSEIQSLSLEQLMMEYQKTTNQILSSSSVINDLTVKNANIFSLICQKLASITTPMNRQESRRLERDSKVEVTKAKTPLKT